RVLLSSQGSPVNWELTRQVAVAGADAGTTDPTPTDDDRQAFEDAVRIAELQVAGFTGLSAPTAMAQVEVVRRAAWVQSTIDDLKELIEPAAARIAEGFSRMGPEALMGGDTSDLPDAAADADADADALAPGSASGSASEANPFAAMMGEVAPLLQAMQAGSVLGSLGKLVLGRYDVAVPRIDNERLIFVVPNISVFERDWSLPEMDFRQWVAMHEVTTRFAFAQPWVRPRLLEVVKDFLSTLEVDVSDVQRRLEQLDPSDPQGVQQAFEDEPDLFSPVLDAEQRIKLARIQSFVAATVGYVDHVTHALGSKMLGSYGQISEAMKRYREGETGDPVFERLLGIEMPRERLAAGRAFCDRVAEETGEATLATMWSSAEALPSMPEIDEPLLWMARSA
ncbi:MAG: zinc-dependent metalloprotease, partial [Actinomycetota bacterium]